MYYIVNFNMDSLSAKEVCRRLGLRLRAVRIKINETQVQLGVRAGVSRNLIGRMEKGDSSVSLEKWLRVAVVLGLLDTWNDVFSVKEDPFDVFDREEQEATALAKKRVRSKKR